MRGAGWGSYAGPAVSGAQSEVLREVGLVVSGKRYRAHKMLGTELARDPATGQYRDACAGDSG